MNRLDFIKEMKTGLFKTVTSIYEPIIEEDREKLNKLTDQMLGVQWFFFLKEISEIENIVQKYINGRPFIIVRKEQMLLAYSGICPSCSQLLNVSIQNSTCKCYICEKETKLDGENRSNSFILKEVPLKKEHDGYYIGLKKNSTG